MSFSVILSPYTGNEQNNYLANINFLIWLETQGIRILSPILYGHVVSMLAKIEDTTFERWQWLNEIFPVVDCFYVLCLPGWQNSYGLTKELELLRKLGKPIKFYDVIEDDKKDDVYVLINQENI